MSQQTRNPSLPTRLWRERHHAERLHITRKKWSMGTGMQLMSVCRLVLVMVHKNGADVYSYATPKYYTNHRALAISESPMELSRVNFLSQAISASWQMSCHSAIRDSLMEGVKGPTYARQEDSRIISPRKVLAWHWRLDRVSSQRTYILRDIRMSKLHTNSFNSCCDYSLLIIITIIISIISIFIINVVIIVDTRDMCSRDYKQLPNLFVLQRFHEVFSVVQLQQNIVILFL